MTTSFRIGHLEKSEANVLSTRGTWAASKKMQDIECRSADVTGEVVMLKFENGTVIEPLQVGYHPAKRGVEKRASCCSSCL